MVYHLSFNIVWPIDAHFIMHDIFAIRMHVHVKHFLAFIMQGWNFILKKSDGMTIWLEAWERNLSRCWWLTITATINISFKMIFYSAQNTRRLCDHLLSSEFLKHPPWLIQLEIFSAFSQSGFKENTGAPTNIWLVWKHHQTCHGLLGTTMVEVAWMTTRCNFRQNPVWFSAPAIWTPPYCMIQYTCMILVSLT